MGRAKKDDKKNEKPVQVENTEQKKRGREKGFTVETPKAFIYITDTPYRIDESDGRNKIIQKSTIKIRTADEKDDDDNKGVAVGEEYTKWINVLKCYRSNYKSAFYRLHEVMVEDEVRSRQSVSIEEFNKLYKEKNDLLEKMFASMFDEEQNLKPKKKVKGE
jgi:hypothetical protein